MGIYQGKVNLEDDLPVRVDIYIAEHLGVLSRSQLKQRLISLTIDNNAAKLSKSVKSGDWLEFKYRETEPLHIKAENIDLDVLYENPDIIVINKPQGMSVHPGAGQHSGTLVNALMYRYQALQHEFADNPERPGIVHRLDKDTSGVIIIAKNLKVHEILAKQFQQRRVKKQYLSITRGYWPNRHGAINPNIIRDPRHRKRFTCTDTAKGKQAQTHYTVLKTFSYKATSYSFVAFKPVTGRTHQIRVHTLSQNCPILGDPIYSAKDPNFPTSGLMLHARKLCLKIPEKDRLIPWCFKAPLPDRFQKVLTELISAQ